MSKTYSFAKVVVSVFFIIGLSVFMITVHELKHYYDIKDEVAVSEICIMNLPIKSLSDSNLGYVSYFISDEDPESSEFMAGLYGLIPFTIFAFIGTYFIIFSEDFRKNCPDIQYS